MEAGAIMGVEMSAAVPILEAVWAQRTLQTLWEEVFKVPFWQTRSTVEVAWAVKMGTW